MTGTVLRWSSAEIRAFREARRMSIRDFTDSRDAVLPSETDFG